MKLAKGDNLKRWRKQDWVSWENAIKIIEQCSVSEKMIFRTWEEAEQMRDKQEEKWMVRLRIYVCEHCEFLHLTSKVY